MIEKKPKEASHKLTLQEKNKSLILRFKTNTIDEGINLFKLLLRKYRENEYENIIFDFSSVKYINSSGIAEIVAFYRIARVGGKLRLYFVNISPHIKKLFELVEIDKLEGIEIKVREG
jgi:anti-anti-sigma factor